MNAPTIIRIQEQAEQDGQFHALISFNHGPEYSVTVRDPFENKQEAELDWYFEEHLRFPFTNQVRAKKAAASITAYGEALFQQAFRDNPDVYAEYKSLLKTGLDSVRIEIMGKPAFHALHWEALKDPAIRDPLSLQAVMVRQNKQPPPVQADAQSSPTINLLVVTSRPYGVRDVSYRTISRPLVEALREANLRVAITILRPGTYKMLVNHLQDMTGKHGAGYYHVIHFDLHGSLMSYAQLKRLNKPQEHEAERVSHRHTYQDNYALDDIKPFEGSKAFLFFEGEQNETVTPVVAEALAKMLLTHHIPIAILNACQSGKQVGESETSLASHLMQAGVQLVLAMGYSITVTAAEKLMTALYQHLFVGDDLSLAIRHARTELYKDKPRRAYYAQQIDLEDWILPVVYQNRPARLTMRDLTPDESKTYYEQQAALSRTASFEPTYGFIGRDLDILQIERRLLLSRNILLIRGMGGAGKTTLLRHLAAWWHTTGLIKQVFSFGYDERAWARQQILVEIAHKLLDPVAYTRDFQPLSLDAQQAFLTKRLRAERHLLILDNLESITSAHLAIQHTLDKTEQEALRRFLADLAGGKTLVLLGSRGGESWLAKGTFEKNVYDLYGLDPEAASMLADRILECHNATKYRQDDDFQHLLTLLDGFPLALEVVLSNLARQKPAEVLDGLRGGNIRLDIEDSDQDGKDIFELKTESILHCIDYSHSNLSSDAQRLLLCLAPFTSVFWLDMLDTYTNHLKQQTALADLPVDRWQEVLHEAVNWGLLSPDANIPRLLRLQPTLTFFLRSRLAIPDQNDVRDAINVAFRAHYNQVSDSFYNLLRSNNPEERRAGLVITRLEYENLTFAQDLSLKAMASIFNTFRVLSDYLDDIMDRGRGLELSEYVLSCLNLYPSEKLEGPLGYDLAKVIDSIAMRKIQLNDYTAAETWYLEELSVWMRNKSFPIETVKRQIAHIYRQLGTIAEELLRWDLAEHYYKQALDIYTDIKNQQGQARIYHNLGLIAQKQSQWQRAKEYYLKALDIKGEFSDPIRLAHTYGQLAMLAFQQQEWDPAKQYYQKALQIFIDFNDFYEQAGTYLNMGLVAQAANQWDQAEQLYQRALQIYINFGHRQEQAKVYHNLGIVAQKQQQWQQGEEYLLKALQLKIEFNDRLSTASTYGQLGVLVQMQGKLGQAQDYLLQALGIYAEYEDNHNGAITAHNLMLLWQKGGVTDVPRAIAEKLGMEVSEVERVLCRMLENEGGEKS